MILDLIGRDCFIQSSHFHDVKLVTVKVEWVGEYILNVNYHHLNDRVQLHFQAMNAMAELGSRHASFLKLVVMVTEHFVGNFLRLREQGKMWHDEADVVHRTNVV